MKEQIEYQNMESSQEQEIDLIELIKRMWVNRKLILKVTGVCFVRSVDCALQLQGIYGWLRCGAADIEFDLDLAHEFTGGTGRYKSQPDG